MNIEHNLNEWRVVTDRYAASTGYLQGRIVGAPGGIRWSNEPGSELDSMQAANIAAKHNEWLRRQRLLLEARRRVRECSLERSLALAKASEMKQKLEEAEALVAALEKELEEKV